jgi:hypothetical protein
VKGGDVTLEPDVVAEIEALLVQRERELA